MSNRPAAAIASTPSDRAPAASLANVLEIRVRKQLGATLIDVEFASAGRVTALFGPSGSGKTSIVNMIAGLLSPDRGRIVVADRVLFDAAARVSIPVHKRRVGYVFQEARLFPHMSVRSNLGYGRLMNRLPVDRQEEARFLNMLNIGHLLDRKPGKLSGGEKQRIGIGRALLAKPQLLLLDEPLASLDRVRKAEILPYLERLRDSGIPMVYVTHATDEVERVADTVIHLADGQVQEIYQNVRRVAQEARSKPHI
jgi:molybdate transport system ATP-binding protein